MSSSNTTMTTRLWLLLFLLSVIWGGSFLFGEIAVEQVPPLTLVFLRVFFAAVTLNIILLFVSGSFQHSWKIWGAFAVMGLLNNILPFSFIFYGQTQIGAGLASIINAMTPIWTLIIANSLLSDERFTTQKIIGVVLGFLGVAVLIGSTALTGLAGSTLGQLSVLGATISYGFAGVFGRRFAGIPPMQTARGQLTTSSLAMLPIIFIVDQPFSIPMPDAKTWGAVIALAVICTAFAYILFFKILSEAGSVNVSLVTFLIPPSAVFLGITLLGETIEVREWLGMMFILAGLVVIDGRMWKMLAR